MEYGKTSTTKLEQQARKAALSMTSAIFKKASELMTLARSRVEEVPSAEFLSTSCLVTTLLPLIGAHITPLVTSDPRVSIFFLNNNVLTNADTFLFNNPECGIYLGPHLRASSTCCCIESYRGFNTIYG